MLVEISMADDASADSLPSLEAWLRRDRDLRRDVVFKAPPEKPLGTMGTADVISMVLTHAEAIGGIVLAFAAWRTSRRQPPGGIQVKVGNQIVIVSRCTPEEIAQVVKELSNEAG
ncbi:hypothetical protein Dvina_36510 [Dactylosporangium vinaceum]|uniref:RCK C-terminal domain-containing protein n=1 Tax=Dactylosporangium vinaceum TaxID=53362 RepID=A0ABV5MJ14_9ACTN|nr:hypothetical protein [Dactylosporangium vinaceum]UAB93694.1 hypothetical protein Dvina_36510 [Dactylosporangium vinaceum]